MGQMDADGLTLSQEVVEKLIKEQNFNWKVRCLLFLAGLSFFERLLSCLAFLSLVSLLCVLGLLLALLGGETLSGK